ncbi:hypothetical protein NEF87_004368 [Candidatus Lokiarchaeum ossiferum]|uniref:2-oxoacid dehydrogenase acyltransferase catalytic domain-containing protein n=1 Tax=Candidatus Lokiarchaeum ossiferum TaxID=2951803 RepID=A0ABY6HX28_9ARCH|nr:hypothetical protein NEF87_004368 [Candidatus Lokiarchaeum sp. B-35]
MGRYDATIPYDLPSFRVIEPHVMKAREDGKVNFSTQFDLTKTLPYIKEYNKNLSKNQKLSLFDIILCAASRAVAEYPEINRFISGRKYWQRNRIQFSFVVKKQLSTHAKETFAKVTFSPYSTIESVRKLVHEEIGGARSSEGNETEAEADFFGHLPRFVLMIAIKLFKTLEFFGIMPKSMIEPDPLYSSIVFANLGSIGLEGQLNHHMFEWGNASWFIVVNKIRTIPVVNEKGEIVPRTVTDIGITLDERISEGMYYIKALKAFKTYSENPELLEKVPTYTQEQIDAMALCDPRDRKKYKEFLKDRKQKAREYKKARNLKKHLRKLKAKSKEVRNPNRAIIAE